MNTETEFKQCKCGYSIIVYVLTYEMGQETQFRFFDGHSGNYEQTYVCPGCHDRLDYATLNG